MYKQDRGEGASGQAHASESKAVGFERSRRVFEEVVSRLAGPQTGQLSHAAVEEDLVRSWRELMRTIYQDHLDLRAQRRSGQEEVTGTGQVVSGHVEPEHAAGPDHDPR